METNKPLSPAHMKFVEKYAETSNQTLSYRYAYPKASYTTAKTEAGRLLVREDIKKEIELKKEELAQKFELSKEKMLNELIQSADKFLEMGDNSNYLKAKDMIIKMGGYYAPKSVDVTSAGERINLIFDLNEKSDESGED